MTRALTLTPDQVDQVVAAIDRIGRSARSIVEELWCQPSADLTLRVRGRAGRIAVDVDTLAGLINQPPAADDVPPLRVFQPGP